MLESEIQHKIIAKLKDLGYLPVKCMLMSLTGFPDIIVFGYHGECFFIECKQSGMKPTHLQEWVHGLLRARGFVVYVLDSPTLPNEIQIVNP